MRFNLKQPELDDQQREYLLNQQLKTIQEELGVNVFQEEIESMRDLSKNKQWTIK